MAAAARRPARPHASAIAGDEYTPWVRLAAAVLCRAALDAQGGDHEARAWLAGEVARGWLDVLDMAHLAGRGLT